MATSDHDTDAGASGPQLVSVDHATTAVVRGVIPTAELRSFFDRSFRALGEVLSSQEVTISGPAFGLFHGAPRETADLEVGFVTDREIQPKGDVSVGSLPGGRVARLVHFGAYDALGSSWERLGSWIGERGLTPGPMMWECYLTEPSPEMDPQDLRSELNWPVTG